MSHFSVLVFAKPNDVHNMLEPFNENEQVEEYCKGEVDFEQKKEFLKYYSETEPEISKDKTFSELYEIFGKNWNGNSYKKVDGVWKMFSTYNPNSKWDWYEIGGRWSGEIPNNSCKVDKLPEGFIPFAFIDQNGQWHEKGKMGWWGISTNEMEDELWETEVKKALENYKGYVTLVDCHI